MRGCMRGCMPIPGSLSRCMPDCGMPAPLGMPPMGSDMFMPPFGIPMLLLPIMTPMLVAAALALAPASPMPLPAPIGGAMGLVENVDAGVSVSVMLVIDFSIITSMGDLGLGGS